MAVQIITPSYRNRTFVPRQIPPARLGLMAGSVSPLASRLAAAGLTGHPLSAFAVGLPRSESSNQSGSAATEDKGHFLKLWPHRRRLAEMREQLHAAGIPSVTLPPPPRRPAASFAQALRQT